VEKLLTVTDKLPRVALPVGARLELERLRVIRLPQQS